ncbi:MAG: FHA domain-containing protein [Myxococcaceae bacterium]|nr:FHA domain-containing protein [Myxococcaceae bacterium]
MPPPDDKKGRSNPLVQRGGASQSGSDPERKAETVVGPKNPLVQRGGGSTSADPERSRETEVGVSNPLTVPPPKRRPRPIDDGGSGGAENSESTPSPEKSVSQKSQTGKSKRSVVSWVAPPGELSARHRKPEPSGYRTGHEYEPIEELQREHAELENEAPNDTHEEDDPVVPRGPLEGDGLDALDPDLPVDEDDEEVDQATPGTSAGPPMTGETEDDGNATTAGRPLKLEIIAGPDKGETRRFKGVRMVIGRTSGIEVQLTDQSVSRRHVELVVSDTGVLLRDLQSGNGTKVNGEKVAERLLVHGDVITIGKTQLRLVDEVAAFEKLRAETEAKEQEEQAKSEAAAQAKAEEEAVAGANADDGAASGEAVAGEDGGEEKHEEDDDEPAGLWDRFKALEPKKQKIVGGAAIAVVLLLVGGLVFRPGPRKPVDTGKTEAAALMQKAREAMTAGKFDEAVGMVGQAEKLSPGIDQQKLGKQAADELKNQKALDTISALIDTGKLEEARQALAALAPGTAAAEVRRQALEKRLKASSANAAGELIERLIAAGELEKAEAALQELPAGPEKAALAAQVEEGRRSLAEALESEQQQVRSAAANADQERTREQVVERASAFSIVQRKFLANDWVRAAAECDRVIESFPGNESVRKKAKALQSQIPTFGRLYDEGLRKFTAGNLVQAAPILKEARKVYLQMGLESSLGRDLEEKLTQAAITAGKDALLRDDLAQAMVYFREALSVEPKNARAQAGVDEVASHAEDLYRDGYGLKGMNAREAAAKFRLVMQITPKNSELYKRAQNQLAGLNSRTQEASP